MYFVLFLYFLCAVLYISFLYFSKEELPVFIKVVAFLVWLSALIFSLV